MSRLAGKMIQAAAGGAVDEGDENFKNVTLALDFDGSNLADNDTWTDSAQSRSVTDYGPVYQGSFSPYGKRWSGNFYNGSSRLEYAASSEHDIRTGDFTMECFCFYRYFANSIAGIFELYIDETLNAVYISRTSTNEYKFQVYRNGSETVSITGGTAKVGEWQHIAAVKSGATYTLFVDGESVGTDTGAMPTMGGNAKCHIGAHLFGAPNRHWRGYISSARLVKGRAVYTGNFTVPESRLEVITDTGVTTPILSCAHENFLNRGSGGAYVESENVYCMPIGPYELEEEITPSTHGGSTWFDRLGENGEAYLRLGSHSSYNIGNSDFTLEMWFYLDEYRNYNVLFDQRNTNSQAVPYLYSSSNGYLRYYRNGTELLGGSTTKMRLKQWTHLVVERVSNVTKMFFDGVEVDSASDAQTYIQGSYLHIGMYFAGIGYIWDGYISDVRYTIGSSVYNHSVTVPTAPLTVLANTKLLLSMQDAAIYDKAGINNFDTYGGAAISTGSYNSVPNYKFGTGGGECDSGDDHFAIEDKGIWNTIDHFWGPFTVEGWIKNKTQPGTGNQQHAFIGKWNNVSDRKSWLIALSGSEVIGYISTDGSANTYTLTSSGAGIGTDTWYHLALSWDGSTYRLFVDGTLAASASSSTPPHDEGNTDPINESWGTKIGIANSGGSGSFNAQLDGWVDEIRVTNGHCRYTANFTPESEAFKKF